ncbi:MAG TPA: hypothetical protein VLJ68_04005 [Chitinophagaceae bacterium]|nr:hypothetical protein [Chitinophagaceae bacterium]
MKAGTTIRKFLFIGLWLVIGGGMLTLLLAAMGKKKRERCQDYSILLKSDQKNFFIDKQDIQQMLVANAGGTIRGQSLSTINLRRLEQLLEENEWIRDAELYFDNQDILHVNIYEREPVARIFNNNGMSFYIDSACRKLPLSDKCSARVPVFTGFPSKNIITAKDSILLSDISSMARFILHDVFWMAQVSEVDITPERNFEMIPVIGNHVVKLGNAENITAKFHRLFVFYQQVLSKTGFDKYKWIDVQFQGQVVASKQSPLNRFDSVQLRKNVEKLLRQPDDERSITPALNTGVKTPDPNPVKSFLKKSTQHTPKAVMPGKTG